MLDFNSKNKFRIFEVYIISLAMLLLLFIQTFFQIRERKNTANRTSLILLDQVLKILGENKVKKDIFIEDLQDTYILKAKTAAYMINKNQNITKDFSELNKIANLLSVDEINLFNKEGTIFSGTVPSYFGVTMNDGAQIEFFKPMLKNKNLELCQNLTPNTAEGKDMIYAMVWSENKEYLIQIGIGALNINKELNRNKLNELINSLPMYEGIDIFVANRYTGNILASTNSIYITSNLYSLGIEIPKGDLSYEKNFNSKVMDKKAYFSLKKWNDYCIGVIQYYSLINKGLLKNFFYSLTYLLLATTVILIIFKRLSYSIESEKKLLKISNTDELTHLYNRRLYEKDIDVYKYKYPEDDFIYISVDINELKKVNDTLGHLAGDELIIGTANCLRDGLSHYGKIYRTGGDEFIAILHTNKNIKDIIKRLKDLVDCWHGKFVDSLSISIGYALKTEFKEPDILSISKLADKRMYDAKTDYYKKNGIDRRKN